MGHLSITRADLTDFECDDWLIPTDRRAKVELPWWKGREQALRAAGARKPHEGPGQEVFPNGGARFKSVDAAGTTPRAWLGRTAAGRPDLDWYVSGATEFVDLALADSPGAARNGRERKLLALPVIGSGKGGGSHKAGAVLDAMVRALARKAPSCSADIALVTFHEEDFAAAQAVRRHGLAEEPWPELDAGARRLADCLAADAAAGKLIIFLGAGMSRGSGLLSWEEMLASLMQRAGLDEEEIREIQKWDALDRAQYIERALSRSGTGSIGQEVASLMESEGHPNLALSMIANLPVEGFITTNYDRLFERAAEEIDIRLAVLPYSPTRTADKWLLKMHGCVGHPEDIVLTRKSYNGYAERNQALAGIVQAMLITRRMLFLGFSLSDDNFLRIVDTVRSAISGSSESAAALTLGTALTLKPEPVKEKLWAGELELYSPSAPGEDDPVAARRMEIFLDYLLFKTASTRHLLNPRFADALDDEERALADALKHVLQEAPGKTESTAWAIVRETLRRLGAA